MALLRRLGLKNTAAMAPYLRERGHDLIAIAKELRIPAKLLDVPVQIKLRRDGDQIAVEAAHQAWRYGVAIDPEDESKLHCWMEAICQWAAEEELR